jgi:hypothetical protein
VKAPSSMGQHHIGIAITGTITVDCGMAGA